MEDSKEPEWSISTVPTLGPYDEIVFKNGRGFSSTLRVDHRNRVDYRKINLGLGTYPIIRFLEILEEYDKWRDRNENRKAE